MKELQIGQTKLLVKDYYCTCDGLPYLKKADCKLWLYINLTDGCNAACPFCVNPSSGKNTISIEKLRATLNKIKAIVYGVSITGGEPMLYPTLVDEVALLVSEVFDTNVELDLVTNGVNLRAITELKTIDRFESIHISRHILDDSSNRLLMGFNAPSWEDIEKAITELTDKAKIVLNCVMQKGGVGSQEDITEYLDKASSIGIKNVSFIGLIQANTYCEENYVSPATLDFSSDDRFNVWNVFQDYSYCSCSSGDYVSKNGTIRYYYRCPSSYNAKYCRQLVYSTDNKLLDGFGGCEIII